MHLCDVTVHIDDDLSAEQKARLEDGVRELPGVVAPRFNSGQKHIMLVAFDPEAASAASLLAGIRAHGYRAQLVSM